MTMPLNLLTSPLGAVCLAVICITSLINIYATWIQDGLLGRLLYMCTALTSAAGLVGYYTGDNAGAVAGMLIVLFAIKAIRNVCVRTSRHYKHEAQPNAQHKR